MAALLAVTLWVYRPVSLAEAADARTGLEPKVVVVVRLDEMDGNGTSHEYQAYDPALLEQMELLVDTARLRLVRRSSIAPLDGMCKIDQKRFITMIGVEVDRLIDLINDILKLSELESVTIPQSEERSDVLTIARDTAAFLTPTAKAAEVTLSVDGGPATVAVPQGRLKELLLNLVGNGIKYNEPGGTVHTAVSVRDGQAVIAVSDTGIGIPPEAQSRVFERFYRVDKGRARKNGGTGLGLAIVKHIVQLYGGTLTLESAVGKGSTFTVTLPLAKDNA